MGYVEISKTEQTAKKEHVCFGCNEYILPGQRYRRDVGTYYGDFQVTKFCPACLAVFGEFCSYLHREWGLIEFSNGDVGEYRKQKESEAEEAIANG